MQPQRPACHEAEKCILGQVLLDNGINEKVFSRLEISDFDEEKHRTIYKAMYALYVNNNPIDHITVADELFRTGRIEAAGGMSYLSDLADYMPSSANVNHYVNVVRGDAILRKIQAAALEMSSICADSSINMAEYLDSCVADVASLHNDYMTIRKPSSTGASMIGEIYQDRLEVYHRQEQSRAIPFGFRDLDAWTGGMFSGNLIVLGARQSMGKTALALDIALNVMAARGGVIIYTFEMLRSEIADRLAAKQTHIYPIRLKKGSLDDYQILQYEELVRKNKTAPIIVDDRHATDTDLISRTDTHLNTLSRAEVPLDLIVVDHLHVMGSRDHRHTSEKAKLEAYTHSLKQLAKDHNCAVLLLSQVTQEASRRLDDPLPRISDFRGASAMREDANIALGLYLPHKDSPEVAPNLAKVVILKNRDGDTGLVSLKWVGQFMQFTNTERWDEEGM